MTWLGICFIQSLNAGIVGIRTGKGTFQTRMFIPVSYGAGLALLQPVSIALLHV